MDDCVGHLNSVFLNMWPCQQYATAAHHPASADVLRTNRLSILVLIQFFYSITFNWINHCHLALCYYIFSFWKCSKSALLSWFSSKWYDYIITSKGSQPCLGLLEKVLLEKAFLTFYNLIWLRELFHRWIDLIQIVSNKFYY